MKVSDKGLYLIKSFESLFLRAYPDPGTGGKPWTIGYGHTRGVNENDTCTESEALDWLREDCETAEEAINDRVDVDLNQNQYDALVSLVFNIGGEHFRTSTLLSLLNKGDYEGAAKQFTRWTKANGRELPGLLRRRAAEAQLFLEAT